MSFKWTLLFLALALILSAAAVRVAAVETSSKAALDAKSTCVEICKNNAAVCKKNALRNGKNQSEANSACGKTCSAKNGYSLCVKELVKLKSDIQDMNTKVDASWSELQKQMDRRNDELQYQIPDLITEFEGMPGKQNIIDALQDARTRYLKAVLPSKKMAANNQIDDALYRLFRRYEERPVMSDDVELTRLKDDLDGSESRISMFLRYYNKDAQALNRLISENPYAAQKWGFKTRPYYTQALRF